MKLFNVFISIIFICACSDRNPPKFVTGNEGKFMPVIDLKLIDTNQHFNTRNVPKGRPAILFSFEPWCPFCKVQTKSILSNIESLKNINIYFLTNSAYPDFKKFYDRYQIGNYTNIVAGIDYNYIFSQYFKTNQVPFMAIYDEDRKLKQVLVGRNYVSAIKKVALSE